jgi:Integrase core domain
MGRVSDVFASRSFVQGRYPGNEREGGRDAPAIRKPSPQAGALGAIWKEEYNTERPHSPLRYQTPAGFAATCERYLPIDEGPLDPSHSIQTNMSFPLSLDQDSYTPNR